MGRSGASSKTRRFGMPTRGLDERARAGLTAACELSAVPFVVLTAVRAGGRPEIVVGGLDDEQVSDLRTALSKRFGGHVKVDAFEEIEAEPIALAALMEGEPLIDRDGLWQTIKQREDEVRGRAAVAADQLSDEAWAALDRIAERADG